MPLPYNLPLTKLPDSARFLLVNGVGSVLKVRYLFPSESVKIPFPSISLFTNWPRYTKNHQKISKPSFKTYFHYESLITPCQSSDLQRTLHHKYYTVLPNPYSLFLIIKSNVLSATKLCLLSVYQSIPLPCLSESKSE